MSASPKPKWVEEAEADFAAIREAAIAMMAGDGRTGEPEIEDLRRARHQIEKQGQERD